VTDARQRLGTGQAFALEVDLRLVPHLEPAVAQRLVDLDPGTVLRGHRIDERAPFVLAELFDRSGPAPVLLCRVVRCHQGLVSQGAPIYRHNTLKHWY